MQEISSEYQGVAMTLIDTISTLAVLGNSSEFQRNVNWLVRNVRPLPQILNSLCASQYHVQLMQFQVNRIAVFT